MFNVIAKAAGLSLLALAALPAIALTAAHAETVTVRVSDLDLSRPAQVATFNGRVEHAAQRFCTARVDSRNLSAATACRHGVRAEAMEQLNSVQRDAIARNGAITLAAR